MPVKHRKRREWSTSIPAERAAAFGVSLPQYETTERFLSPNDIGKILNITGEAVKQWIYHRRLPAVKLANGYWKVRASDLELFLRAKHDMARRRIMVVGRNRNGSDDVASVINHLGHIAVTTDHPLDAILKFNDINPALVVINCSANNRDCWTFAERVRATKAGKNIPILLIADSDMSESDADKAVTILAKGFIKRPVTQDELAREIDRILKP